MACRSIARVALFVMVVAPALTSARLHVRAARRRSGSLRTAATCATLASHESHYTVELQVGSPPQKFDVVADTGSSAVIINSCVCMSQLGCDTQNKCFTGNRSTSFALKELDQSVAAVAMMFGSGRITSVVATDVVRVGGVEATMTDGLLLMVDSALDFSGPFEGILGLGTPSDTDTGHGFIERTGLERFSVCINPDGDGALRLGSPVSPRALGSIGQVHWGLGLDAISVGNTSAVVQLCSPSSMTAAGQLTPCGAIPDSGTTLLMAPAEHLAVLFSSICDSWPRCSTAALHQSRAKDEVFREVLYHCDDWLTEEGSGLEEMPDVHFTLSGAGGAKQTVAVPGTSYIFATYEDEMHYITKYIGGIFPVRVPERTGKKQTVCAPAFGPMEYITALNGPVWILGLPLFYEFRVGYDVHARPPTISFSEESCGTCADDTEAALIASGRTNFAANASVRQRARRPRELHAPPRMPKFDARLPL